MSLTAFIEHKSNMFVVSVLAVIGILFLPIIIPNIFHGFHIAHISLHIAGISLATFLTISAAYAYTKIKTRKLAITAIAFSMFVVSEIIKIIDVTWPYTFYFGTITMEQISHMLIIGMLGIFSIGVFRRD
ncbi:hypothetical protein [Candidatus Nitrosotenuis aquarius]|uniref:hypothetical protein n=1 Tax=Candidatus Nitrosotenuis aquarius TaxID=1846278 RepID=UPI000C1F1FB1|nr:hypothetical protein [Candidatus Nitrosotenuis aquarius]